MSQGPLRTLLWLPLLAATACQTQEPATAPAPSTTAIATAAPTTPPAAPSGETATDHAQLAHMAPLQQVPTVPDDEEPLAILPTVQEVADELEIDLRPARVDLGRFLFLGPRPS